MTQYRQVPTFELPMHERLESGETINTSWWYRYFQAHDFGVPPGAETVVTPTGSPFKYRVPRKGTIIVSGGTVSSLTIARSGPFYTTGTTSGTFHLAQGDQLQITYTVVPTVVFLPT